MAGFLSAPAPLRAPTPRSSLVLMQHWPCSAPQDLSDAISGSETPPKHRRNGQDSPGCQRPAWSVGESAPAGTAPVHSTQNVHSTFVPATHFRAIISEPASEAKAPFLAWLHGERTYSHDTVMTSYLDDVDSDADYEDTQMCDLPLHSMTTTHLYHEVHEVATRPPPCTTLLENRCRRKGQDELGGSSFL